MAYIDETVMPQTQRVADEPRRVIRGKGSFMKTKHPVRWVVVLAVVIYVVIFSITHKEKVSPPLDYNRPVYTTNHAIVCPMSLLSDPRADHDYHAVLDMYMSIFTADSQAAKLGCEVLTGGIRVVATPGPDVLVTVNKVYFTVEAHLTNNADGTRRSADSSPSPSTPPSATQDETFDASKASINTAPTSPIPSSNGSGTMWVSSPSEVPMLKGDVNAANVRGFGVIICPDSKAFAAYLDTFDAPNKKTTSDLETNMRRFGCSYFPPSTPMVSEGGDPKGSLVAVKVNLSDNRTVVGVTFSNWIVQNEQQREKAIQQPLTEKQTTQSEPQTAPTVYQVENPAPPAQTPSIPEPLLTQLKTRPNDPELLTEIGNIYYDTKQFKDAIDYYARVLKIQPSNTNVRTDMGIAYWKGMRDADAAIREFNKALSYEPNKPQTLQSIGIVKWQGKSDAKGAVAAWEKLLQTNPGYDRRADIQQLINEAKGQ
jgi:hypothetical protein